mmetsp:Transcript_6911/g.16611  ORF Transcript_6911/g.16611 Transcript_6911/m.16611 type:complete len:242 (-) Transcript_6911:590-1315(-)
MVDSTMSSQHCCTGPGNALTKSLRIVPKIEALPAFETSTRPTTLKWRRKRGVTSWRPPPGGPIEPTNTMSMMARKPRSPVRSYQPPWSNHWRRISIGGCAPYSSRLGMLRSSTCTMNFLPAGGPNVPRLRLSSLASIMSWVMLADVCAEKLMVYGRAFGLTALPLTLVEPPRYCEMLTVLPVPVSPTMRTWRSCMRSKSRRNELRTESEVGTTSSEKESLLSTTYSSTVSIHGCHARFSRL